MGIQTIKTKTEFDNLLKSSGNLILIDFFATWCGPCRMIAPKLEEFSGQYTDVIFAKVDVDENSETAESCGISAMPTFKLYKNGEMVEEVVGASAAKIEEAIKKHK